MPFKSCYHVQAEQDNLATTTTWSLLVYVIGFRVVPPILRILQKKFEPVSADSMSCFRAGIVDGLKAACTPSSGLISAAHVLSFISFLVTPYFYRTREQAKAECQHDQDFYQMPNTTEPLECYTANANKGILNFVITYTASLWLGVYIVMPAVISTLRGWINARQKINEPATGAVAVKVAVENVARAMTWAEAWKAGLKESEMSASAYSLFDVSQLTAIGFGVVPLLGYVEKFRSQADCRHKRAEQAYNRTRD